MPAGLKRSSADFFISASVSETAANTYTENEIVLPLDSLSREVFVITGVIFNPATPSRIAGTETDVQVQLTRNSSRDMIPLSEYNLIAEANETVISLTDEGQLTGKAYGNKILESGKDYLDIVATPNMYFATQGNNNTNATTSFMRVYGYRAVASVDTYSALVASELNSGQ